MTFSYYLLKYPYSLIWKIKKTFRKKPLTVLYCHIEQDYHIFKNLDIKDAVWAAGSTGVREYLLNKGINALEWPVYPDAVIMARHTLHRFPCKNIIKVGMRHGPYHFKRMIDSSKYNRFDLYLMTSETEVKTAKNVGINNTVSGGFPKLDSLTDGSIKGTDIKALRTKIGMNNGKKTLLFSSTWKGSGMSALDKWIDRLEELKNEYNILVTIHPLSDKNDRKKLQNTENIYFIEENFIYPYMIMSDALISDTSSIIAEYCVLYKPVIVFDTPDAGRTDPEVSELINKLSYKINGFDDLLNLLPEVWNEPHSRINEQKNAVKIFFDDDSPGKGKRSSDIINTFLKENLYQ